MADREVNYILPPAVALSDILLPRYIISYYDPTLLENNDFQGGGGARAFVLGDADKEDRPYWHSIIGQPVYSMLEFPCTDALRDLRPAGILANSGLGSALAVDMAIFTLNQTKNIVKTAIQGRNGTVKEYIGDGDYAIDITGHFVSPYPNYYPQEEVDQFIKIMKVQSQIPIVAPILKAFGIENVVVERWGINETVGTRNMVSFSISCISDTDDSIVIRNQEAIW